MKWLTKVLKMSLVLVFVFGGLTGCASSTGSELGAQGAIDGLIDQFITAVQNKDEQSLRGCVVSTTSDEMIQDQLQQDISPLLSFEQKDAVYVGQVNDRYYFSKVFYTVNNPSTRDYDSSYYSVNFAIEYENGAWKLNYNDGLDEELKSVLFNTNYFGEASQAASEAGRNIMVGSSPLAVKETDFYLEGALMHDVAACWQNEDGSVTVGFVLSNGMDETVTLYNGSFTITDSVLGEVLNGSIPDSFTLEPEQSMYVAYTYGVDSIATGMQTWNQGMHFHTDFDWS